MAVNVQHKWTYAQQVEKEITFELEKKKDRPSVELIDRLVQELRNSCQETIFLDFQYATENGVESRLWGMHTLIKERHKRLVKAATAQNPRNVVEIRKLKKRYADFIKTSQHFYKGYVQRLASTYSGMSGLRRIAHRLSLETLSADNLVKVSPELERLIDASCHATLLRLGDLSRYRNEIRTKDRSWEPALGYYSLASNLCPDSGSSHNQMAVIALADQNHLDAVYHLYRAIAIKEPHQLAKGNLEIEFKKITTAWEKKHVPHAKLGSTDTLILWFVRLHAKLYKGTDFSTHNELESEVLTRLVRLLEEKSSEITLEKLVVINIAAEYFAVERSQGRNSSPDTRRSFLFLLRFNIRMITALLEVLRPELEDSVSGEELPKNPDGLQSSRRPEKISAIARRVLPALRQYSTWLVSRSSVIATTCDALLTPYVKDMWILYAQVLTKIASVFPVEELATVSYLLEEDEMTIGFMPLRDPNLNIESDLYVDEDGTLKSRLTDPGIERNHPNVEMVARVRDIILCALTLYSENRAPITLKRQEFLFVERLPVPGSVETQISHAISNGPINAVKANTVGQKNTDFTLASSTAVSDSHHNMDTEMHRMVDDLLEPSSGRHSASNETSYGMHSLTANAIFAPMCSNESPQHNTPKMLPSLPGIWQSPFTPQPHELLPTTPDRPSTARQLSPSDFAATEQKSAAGTSLNGIKGHGRIGTGSWGRNSQPTVNPRPLPVSQMLHESLSQQYKPMTIGSSAFTDSSSIYANTPRAESHSGGSWNGYNINNGHNTTVYAGASDFERTALLQSSIWDGSQPACGSYVQTPPGGQGG